MFLRTLKGFYRSESGAITLDFVVLTAVAASFGFTIAAMIAMGTNPVTTSLNAMLLQDSNFKAKFVQIEE